MKFKLRVRTIPLAAVFLCLSAAGMAQVPLTSLVPRQIGLPVKGLPWITDVHAADLDGDGLQDVLVCDGRLNRIGWIRQESPGVFKEQIIGATVAGPGHVETADVDADGDLDVLVAGLGSISPSNAHIGSVVIIENLGEGQFRSHLIDKMVPRVSDVRAADFDGDGDLDLVVGMFGYVEGAIVWMENHGDWKFESHALLDYAGTIHTPPVDIDGDGDMDIVALVSQDWEEVHAFVNDGTGHFTDRILYGAGNRNFDSSGIEIADIDGDGDADIAYANGDGFDYATPGKRPLHGVQWLENDGAGNFTYHRLGDASGVYAPTIVDMDGDGLKEILVVSAFNQWERSDAYSVFCFRQVTPGNFELQPMAKTPTHLVTLIATDFDGDGRVELVTGGFHYAPTSGQASRVMFWDSAEPVEVSGVAR